MVSNNETTVNIYVFIPYVLYDILEPTREHGKESGGR
jgi:hypothetical protein